VTYRLRYAAAGVLLLVLALPTLPARLAPMLLEGSGLEMSAVSGSLFSGRAARARWRGPTGVFNLGALRWKLHPASLLRLAPRVSLASDWGAQHLSATLQPGADGLLLTDVDASVDAGLVRELAPLAVDGRLSLTLSRLRFRGGIPVDVTGRAVWDSARWQTAATSHALGTYVAHLETSSPPTITARVETLAGPLDVTGSGSFDGQRFAVDLILEDPARRLDPELEAALRLFATPTEDGYRLRLGATLRIASTQPQT